MIPCSMGYFRVRIPLLDSGTDTQACTMLSGITLGSTYLDGPRTSNFAFSAHCSDWYGTLAEAQAKCSADSGCTALHDYNCDDWGWRYCTSSILDITSAGFDTFACLQVPTT